MTIDTVVSRGRLVADDERYTVHDLELDDLTVSVTRLKKGKSTRGHSHESNAEVYFFPGGEAEMQVGKETFGIRKGGVLIPKGEFHRVTNRSPASDLTFVAVFPGRRKETSAVYAPGTRGSKKPSERTMSR